MDVAINHLPSSNTEFCLTCRTIFEGKFVPSTSSTVVPSRLKLYRFHESFESLQECEKHHACPVCCVVAASSRWGDLPDATETVFSHSREEDMMVMGFMPHGAPDQSSACFVTLWRGRCLIKSSDYQEPLLLIVVNLQLIGRKPFATHSPHDWEPTRSLPLASTSSGQT